MRQELRESSRGRTGEGEFNSKYRYVYFIPFRSNQNISFRFIFLGKSTSFAGKENIVNVSDVKATVKATIK